MTDRVEDVVVPAAVRRKGLVSVSVIVVGLDRARRDVACAQRTHRQPPAIAGSKRTSSRSSTAVLRPSR
jgi:hypothetical protein